MPKKTCNAAPEDCTWIKWMEPQVCISNPPNCPDYHYQKKTCKKLGCSWDKFTELCNGPTDFICSTFAGDKKMCNKRGCVYNKFDEQCYEQGEEQPVVCSDYNGNKKHCKAQGCIYNAETGVCGGEEAACNTFTSKKTCKNDGCEWDKHMQQCFGPDDTQTPFCTDFNGEKKACKTVGCSWDKKTQTCS